MRLYVQGVAILTGRKSSLTNQRYAVSDLFIETSKFGGVPPRTSQSHKNSSLLSHQNTQSALSGENRSRILQNWNRAVQSGQATREQKRPQKLHVLLFKQRHRCTAGNMTAYVVQIQLISVDINKNGLHLISVDSDRVWRQYDRNYIVRAFIRNVY